MLPPPVPINHPLNQERKSTSASTPKYKIMEKVGEVTVCLNFLVVKIAFIYVYLCLHAHRSKSIDYIIQEMLK